MIRRAFLRPLLVSTLVLAALVSTGAQQLPRTPLAQETLDLFANEISGQMAFNNLVKLAGAPWLRDPAEFGGTFYEAQTLYDLVRGYGIDTVRLERHASPRTYDYPHAGELWVVEPEKRPRAPPRAGPGRGAGREGPISPASWSTCRRSATSRRNR